MNPKGILYINPTAKMSGAEFSLLGLMAGLDKARYLPVLLLPEPGLFQERAAALGIDVIVLPSLLRYDERYHPRQAPRVVRSVLAVRKMLRSHEISLVHSNKLGVSFIAGLAARLAGVPVVIHVRDGGLPAIIAPWKGRVLGLLTDRFIAVSRAAGDSLAGVLPGLVKKTTVIHTGINLAAMDRIRAASVRGELGVSPDAPLVGAVGRIEPRKGFDVLVEAARKMTKAFPELRVLIIGPVFEPGDQAYVDGLRRRVRESGLAANVIFTGFRDDVLEIMKAMDVIVHPALFEDPLPRAVLEAAALGKPIVASRVGGIPEILEHGVSGILVAPGDAGALAAAAVSILRDPASARRLSLAARKRIKERFTIGRHVEGITALYDSLWPAGPV